MPADLLDDKAAVCYNETRTVSVRARAEEKYPSGSRGSPAKGVDRIKLVRGFKSRLLRQHRKNVSNDGCQQVKFRIGYQTIWNFLFIGNFQSKAHW